MKIEKLINEAREHATYDIPERTQQVLKMAAGVMQLTIDICDLVCEYTYPGFDKNGKAVNIWKPEGFKVIEKILKEVQKDEDKEKSDCFDAGSGDAAERLL